MFSWSWKTVASSDPVGDALHLATKQFSTVRAPAFVLRHDPQLDRIETAFFRVACSQQIAALEKLLGGRFKPWWRYRPRLQIFLFNNDDDVSRVYGGPAGGFASAEEWSIVVNLQSDWVPMLRHELTHVLTGHWNPSAPTILCEGVAVWAQQTINGQLIDDYARRMLADLDVVSVLLGPRQHSDCKIWQHYAFVGSFTKALIDRFGLRRFEKFYRDRWVNEASFAERHLQHFQLPFAEMVEIWIRNLAGAGVARMLAPRFI